jgi:hypothetical protein
LGKSVEANGKDHHLAGAAGGLEKPPRIGVEASRRIGVDVADMLFIVMIGGDTARGVLDVRLGKGVAVEPVENRFRIVAS